MTRTLTGWHPVIHQKEVMLLDMKGERNGDLYHIMQPNSLRRIAEVFLLYQN